MACLINVTPGTEQTVIPVARAALLIGRDDDDANVVLDSDLISRNHATVLLYGTDYYLRDNGSTNGSFVNGRQVKFEKLNDNDIIQFGPYLFRFKLSDQAAAGVKPPEDKKDYRAGSMPKAHLDDAKFVGDKTVGDKTYTLSYELNIADAASQEEEVKEGKSMKGTPYPERRGSLRILSSGFKQKSS